MSIKNEACGVIVSEKRFTKENINAVKKAKLSLWIAPNLENKTECKYLTEDGIITGYIYYISLEEIKTKNEKLSQIGKFCGFIIPMPCYSGLIWDDSFEKEYENEFNGGLKEKILDIFSKGDETLRIWYYERVLKYSFEKYILPTFKMVKDSKKKIIFSHSKIDLEIDYLRKYIDRELFNENKILCSCEEKDRIEINNKTDRETILYIAPTRFIMQNYRWGSKMSKPESKLNLSVLEERYYRENIDKLGYNCYRIDEKSLKAMSIRKLMTFKDIIIGEDCIFEEDEINKLKKVQEKGILINSKALLEELDKLN